MLPVSLSLAGGPWHRRLRGYKDHPCAAARDAYTRSLAAVLQGFLPAHEACLARASGVGAFAVVTTVPPRGIGASGAASRLDRVVARSCPATAARHEPLLAPGPRFGVAREWSPQRFVARRALDGEAVLLIDDTWTSGASAQAAAHALRGAGAAAVALVVLGRHVQVDAVNGAAAGRPFRWDRCALED